MTIDEDGIMSRLGLYGFEYVTSATFGGHTYDLFTKSISNIFGASGVGTDVGTASHSNIAYGNKLILSSSNTTGACSLLREYRDKTNINLFLPSSAAASYFTGGEWEGWLCNMLSTANQYYASCDGGSSVSVSYGNPSSVSKSKFSVIVNLDDGYIKHYGKVTIGSKTMYWNGTDVCIN